MRRKTSPEEQIQALQDLQSNLTRVLVTVAVVAMAFTATNVTLFAIEHHIPAVIAWLLDPIVAVALGAVLIVDGRLSEHGVHPSGWATGLRWFTGLSTWLMNCWSSLWPSGAPFGVPRQVDPAGLVLHSIPPVLLIVLAEAITFYRRAILDRIAVLRDQVDTPRTTVDTPAGQLVSTPSTPPAPTPVERMVPDAPSLVICGVQDVYTLPVPPRADEDRTGGREGERLAADLALIVIEECWGRGASIRTAARESTRSPSYVQTVYARLNDSGPAQLALVPGGEH
ncbi:hypothetical protein ABZ837_29205 [Streptomyces sp. NPDC047197]|uniref:hypothetical protein n=1 Tax=Streptomyces sp. NPDC047197 TaxID=3155477 RepID=UPI0033D716FF